jgi:hypothetical protein
MSAISAWPREIIAGPLRWRRKQRLKSKHWIPGLGAGVNPEPKGYCLLSYITDFVRIVTADDEFRRQGWNNPEWDRFTGDLAAKFSHHTAWWESLEIVRQFVQRGYIIDLVSDQLGWIVDNVGKYDVIIDERENLARWREVNRHARMMFYGTRAHWLIWNQQELKRLEWLRDRTGCEVAPERQAPVDLGSGAADVITSFGNDAINATFGEHSNKIIKLCISATRAGVPLKQKKWAAAKRRFLWFGSIGWVHKGLDITLEAFFRMPDLELVVCGFHPDFDVRTWPPAMHKCYGERMRLAGNIRLRGYVDPLSEEALSLANSCAALVYPTACEGCSGAAVQCLHFGLIPVVTDFCGLDTRVNPIVVGGKTDSELIQAVMNACREVSCMSDAELDERSRGAWQFANTFHTRESYRESLSAAIDRLLANPAS